jgi:hypothetical protein
MPSRKISPLNRARVLEADLGEILELCVARRLPVHELLQGDIGDDQTGVCISFTVTFIILVIRPRTLCTLGEDEPVLIMIL